MILWISRSTARRLLWAAKTVLPGIQHLVQLTDTHVIVFAVAAPNVDAAVMCVVGTGAEAVPKITKDLLEAHIFRPSPFFAGKFVSDTK